MNFDLVLIKWRESLEIFKKDELKVYLLASLNSFKRSFLVFLKYIGLYYLIFLGILIYSNYFCSNNFFKIFSFFNTVFEFLLFLIIRPSLENKCYDYFKKYSNYFLFFLIIKMLFFKIYFLFALIAFFFLDSDGSLEDFIASIINGFKFVIYYFPFILLFLFINILLTFNNMLFFILFPVIDILLLSFLIMFYIRVKHKDYNLFYK